MELCRGSSSSDHRSRSYSYFGQTDSDDSDSDLRNTLDIPVASTGITMVSLPDSSEDESPKDTDTLPEDDDIFLTAPDSRSTSASFNSCNNVQLIGAYPENCGETVSVDADIGESGKAVDLGKDTVLGFSEVAVGVDLTQRIEVDLSPNDAFRREWEEIRVSKRGISPEGQSSIQFQPPWKKMKSSDFESPIVRLGSPEERNTDEVLKSLEKWKLEMDTLSLAASSELELENQQSQEFKAEVGEGSVRERLDVSTEVIDCDKVERNMECENDKGEGSGGEKSLEENNNGEENSGRNKNIFEDRDQFIYIVKNGLNSCEIEKETERKRALPSWAYGRVGADERVEVNELESVQTDRDLDNASKDGSNLPEMEEKIEKKRALPSWAYGSVEVDEGVEDKDLDNLSEDGSNLPEEKIEKKRALPSWAYGSVEADEGVEVDESESEEVEVDEMESADVEVNETESEEVEVNERESERVEVNGMESGRVEVNERESERMEVNESESAQADMGSDGLSEDSEDTMLLNVLMELKEKHVSEEERNLDCLSLWDIAKENGIEDPDSSAEDGLQE